jgi:ABC-2 type transport system permease protein
MRKTLVIAVREYLAAVRTKSFLVSLTLMPLLMGSSVVLQIIFKNIEDTGEKRFAVTDRTPGEKIFAALDKAAQWRNTSEIFDPETHKQNKPSFVLERIEPSSDTPDAMAQQRFELCQQILAGKYFGLLEIGPDVYQHSSSSRLPDGTQSPAPPKGPAGGREQAERAAVATDPDYAKERLLSALSSADTGNDRVRIRYQTKTPQYLAFSIWAEKIVNEAIQEKRWSDARQPRETVLAILQPAPLVAKGLSKRDPHTGVIEDAATESQIVRFVAPVALIIVMFMMIMVGATPLVGGVLEEKMGRIAEVLLGSVRPFQLMMGKLIGMIGISLTIVAVYLVGLYWAAHHYGLADMFSIGLLAWFLVYLILAVVLYGSMFIAIGSACTTSAETQTLLMPVIIVAVIPMLVLIQVIQQPNSGFSTAISFFPPATPMVMIGRLAVPPGIPWWQPALGVVLLLATTAGFVYAAGRIFRVGLLMQGQGAKFTDLARWVIRG